MYTVGCRNERRNLEVVRAIYELLEEFSPRAGGGLRGDNLDENGAAASGRREVIARP